MTSARRLWCTAVVAVLSSLVLITISATGCYTTGSTTKETLDKEEEGYTPNRTSPSVEIMPYLVNPSSGVIFKAEPGAWHRVAPVVRRVLAAEIQGASDGFESLKVSSNRPEVSADAVGRLFGRLTGMDVDLSHLSDSRPMYLLLSPTRHKAGQGCLSAGLPCLLLARPGPRYGRFLLPSNNPKKLAAEIEKEVGEGYYRTIVHNYHVRVEFATAVGTPGEKRKEQVARHLEIRSRDRPVDMFIRRTPARAALLDEEVPFGVYVNLPAALDAAMYLEQWELNRRMAGWSPGGRMRRVLGATAKLGELTRLEAGDSAEAEDVAVVVNGDGVGNYTLDVVSTRTTQGRRIRRVGSNSISLPPVAVDDPELHLEWSLRLDKLDEEVEEAAWASPRPQTRDLLEQLGGWGAIGLFRAPTAVVTTLAEEVAARTGGFDPRRIIAGRVRLSGVEPEAESLAGVHGGGVLRLAAGSESKALARWFRVAGRLNGRLDTDLSHNSDGTIDVRFGLHRAVEQVVPEGGSPERVARLALESNPRTVRRATGVLFGESLTDSEMAIAKFVQAITSQGAVRLAHLGTSQWSNLRIGLGRDPGMGLTIEPDEFSVRKARKDCFGEVASMTGELISEALARGDVDGYLHDRLSSEQGRFRNAIADCGAPGKGEQQLAQGAIDYFNGWRALVDYRAGNDLWDDRIARICKAGHRWACKPQTGQWPWLRGYAGRAVGQQ